MRTSTHLSGRSVQTSTHTSTYNRDTHKYMRIRARAHACTYTHTCFMHKHGPAGLRALRRAFLAVQGARVTRGRAEAAQARVRGLRAPQAAKGRRAGGVGRASCRWAWVRRKCKHLKASAPDSSDTSQPRTCVCKCVCVHACTKRMLMGTCPMASPTPAMSTGPAILMLTQHQGPGRVRACTSDRLAPTCTRFLLAAAAVAITLTLRGLAPLLRLVAALAPARARQATRLLQGNKPGLQALRGGHTHARQKKGRGIAGYTRIATSPASWLHGYSSSVPDNSTLAGLGFMSPHTSHAADVHRTRCTGTSQRKIQLQVRSC